MTSDTLRRLDVNRVRAFSTLTDEVNPKLAGYLFGAYVRCRIGEEPEVSNQSLAIHGHAIQ